MRCMYILVLWEQMSLKQTSETVSKCPTPIRAEAVSRYNQVMTPGRTKMSSTSHIRDGNAAVHQVPGSLVMDAVMHHRHEFKLNSLREPWELRSTADSKMGSACKQCTAYNSRYFKSETLEVKWSHESEVKSLSSYEILESSHNCTATWLPGLADELQWRCTTPQRPHHAHPPRRTCLLAIIMFYLTGNKRLRQLS